MLKQHSKQPLGIGVAMVAGLLVIGSVLLWLRPAQPQSPAGSEPPTQEARVAPADTAPVTAVPVVASTQPSSIAPPVANVANQPTAATLVSGGGGGAPALLHVKGGEVLATVNGTPIELKDLLPLPLGKEATEQIMSAERYAFLLDRAVDREITLQNARAQRVDLTELQREQLARLGARSERPQENVFDDLQHNPANAEFEARDATVLLLQASLAEKAGVLSRDVTSAQVEQYYQQHQTEYGALPSDSAGRQVAWESIDQDIRVKLARQVQVLHDESSQQYFDQLRASAQIVRTKPTS